MIPEELVESWIPPVQAAGLDVRPIETSILEGRTHGLYRVESSDGSVLVRTLMPDYLEEAIAGNSRVTVRFGIAICA